MRAGGAGCPAKLLAMGWLLLVGLQASQATNVTAIQEPGVAREGESESDVDEEAENDTDVPENEVQADAEEEVQNRTVVKEVEFGMCTVTCGVGIREVILTNGCPGGESKCIVRVEECRGPVDCGWGKPISETLENVRLSCVHISPVNRFKYMWKLLKSDQQPVILANDSAVLEVQRELHPMAFECDTLDSNEIVASIRFTVYTTSGISCQSSFKNSLVLGCSGGTELMGDLVEWFTGYGSGSPTVVFSLWNASNPVGVQSMRLDASADLPTKLKSQLKLQMRRISRPDTDAVLVFVLTIGVIICIFVIFVLIFIIINWAAVKSFWGAKASTTEMHSELSSMRYKDSTSLEQSPADIPVHEDDALSEWNE